LRKIAKITESRHTNDFILAGMIPELHRVVKRDHWTYQHSVIELKSRPKHVFFQFPGWMSVQHAEQIM
jgi:hypothetical protein